MIRFAAGLATKAAGVHLHRADHASSADGLPKNERHLLEAALARWRTVVLAAETPGRYELHLLNFDTTDYPNLLTGYGHTLVWNDKFKALLIYMNGILIVAVVQADRPSLARSTRITVRGATVTAACQQIPPVIASALHQLSDTFAAEKATRELPAALPLGLLAQSATPTEAQAEFCLKPGL